MKKILISFLFLLLSISTIHAQTSKMQLLYVEMEHCPWCHKMNSEIFDNPKIYDQLKSMYKITKMKKGAATLPAFLHPRYYPTTYILSEDGQKVIDELPGYMGSARFLDYLKDLYEIENSEN